MEDNTFYIINIMLQSGADCFIGINQICTPRQTGARRLDPPNALLIEGLVIQERFKSALPLL